MPGLDALRRFARGRDAAPPAAAAERCELCGREVPESHPHLVAPAARRIACACAACAVLFDHGGAAPPPPATGSTRSPGGAPAGAAPAGAPSGGAPRYLRVPTRVTWLRAFRADDAAWGSLGVPVGLAFFSRSAAQGGVVAHYPSAAGVTEAPLDDGAWADIVRAEPALAAMEPDVEALLVHRVGDARDHLIAPIDECYRLAGIVRGERARSLDGGPRVASFIDALKRRAAPDDARGEELRCPI